MTKKTKVSEVEELKSKLKKSENTRDNLSGALAVIFILVAIFGACYFACWASSETLLKYQIGTCLLNRHFEFVIVTKRYEYIRQYSLEYIKTQYDGWDYELKWDVNRYYESYIKDAQIVESTYTEIPCKSK